MKRVTVRNPTTSTTTKRKDKNFPISFSMACCCKERDQEEETLDLLTPLSLPSPPPPPPFLTLSPMNSHFPALSSADLLQAILERLPPRDLARSACVCRLWRAIASDRAMLERAFAGPWGLARVLGTPSSTAFWRSSSLSRFAISHKLVRGDTVAGLALKYSVQVVDIKRLNNMMSDHGIYSRERLLIPIGKPELLSGATCYIELDEHAKREVAVLYLDGGPSNRSDREAGDVVVDMDRRKKKIVDSMRRSLHVDDGTAEYYLSVANGDPRAAMMQYSEDLRWEQRSPHM